MFSSRFMLFLIIKKFDVQKMSGGGGGLGVDKFIF